MALRATKPNEDLNFCSSSTEPRRSASGCFRSRDSSGASSGEWELAFKATPEYVQTDAPRPRSHPNSAISLSGLEIPG